jgi:hypothetical protein
MVTRLNGDTLRWLDTLNREGSFAELSDGQLLQRFLARTGVASEVAFEVLVRRHGPMVLSLCRGVPGADLISSFWGEGRPFRLLIAGTLTARNHPHLVLPVTDFRLGVKRSTHGFPVLRSFSAYRLAVVIAPVAGWVLIARGTAYFNRFPVPSGCGLPLPLGANPCQCPDTIVRWSTRVRANLARGPGQGSP